MKITIKENDYKNIEINNKIVLYINHNENGFSFDVYKKENYNDENYDDGFIVGTWLTNEEIEG